jgi:hypothetical protein
VGVANGVIILPPANLKFRQDDITLFSHIETSSLDKLPVA